MLFARPALSQRDATAGEALFRAGRTAADRGDYSTACPKFEESNRLDPALGTAFNLADCDEHIGKIASAWQLFREVAQRLPAGDDRIAIANGRAAALEPRLPRLILKTKGTLPLGTAVLRDGVELSSASFDLALPVDPGDHVIVIRSPGRADRDYAVKANAGTTSDVLLEVGPVSVTPAPATPKPGPTLDVDTKQTGRSRSPLGVGLIAVGAAGIATGLATGALALSAKKTVEDGCDVTKACTQEALDAADRGRTAATISTIAFGVGLAGTAAGLFVLLSGKADARAPAAVRRAPVEAAVLPGGAFVSIHGSL
jgi:hypothetical protein